MNLVKMVGIIGVTVFLTAGMLTYCSPYQSCVRALTGNISGSAPELVCLSRLQPKGG